MQKTVATWLVDSKLLLSTVFQRNCQTATSSTSYLASNNQIFNIVSAYYLSSSPVLEARF